MTAPPTPEPTSRTIGLGAAVGIGVGAIVGGGILVLAGVGLSAAGPSTLVAFALNGVIAVLTALSFAEMSAAFPQSGGPYTFAKKVLTVRSAFAVGWVLWFAYIVAAVLYGLGFAEYGIAALAGVLRGLDVAPPGWLSSQTTMRVVGVSAAIIYTLSLIRSPGGGGQWETIGKMVLFAVLIVIGVGALGWAPSGTIETGMSPFFAGGATGVLSAMGFTFIALQGFDLIAAVGGEVKDPARTIPKAMLISLGVGMLVYLPLLFIVSTVGVPEGRSIMEVSRESPATVMADAARQFAGGAGYWMVMGAAVLSTLSALSANVLAASRVALTMANDRTLPAVLSEPHSKYGTPVMAIYASSLALAVILLIVPDTAAAGAAASLIFLVSFALVHWMSYLARKRATTPGPFRTPFFPAVQVIGGLACAGLALFQAIAVPSAGAIAAVWLGLGVLLYFGIFRDRARAVDAFAEASDPHLAGLRGKSSLVLVPVANPAHAIGLATLANAMAAPGVGEVVLLTVLRPPKEDASVTLLSDALGDVRAIVGDALETSVARGHTPEIVVRVSADPWAEIAKVARGRRCESLLLGMASLAKEQSVAPLERLLNQLSTDVVVLCAPPGWSPSTIERVVVPIGGRGQHDTLRARILGSLGRSATLAHRFVRILPSDTDEATQARAKKELASFAGEETRGATEADVICSDDVVATLADAAGAQDLLVLGLQQTRGKRLFGDVALRIARRTKAAILLISHSG